MNLLVLGANSDVACAVVKRFAQDEIVSACLASRDIELLEKKAKDMGVRHNIQAHAVAFDALDFASHQTFYQNLSQKPDVIVLAFGYVGDQSKAQGDFDEARRILDSNYTGAASILEIIAADFEKRQSGTIIAISSVAGDRGRQSNYFYGSAKAALTSYLSGLRNRLLKSNVHVLTVLPGFIHTKMTQNLQLPGLITATPEAVADDIYNAYKKSRNLIYTRWYWRWIMTIIKNIPETVFKRMKL